MLISEGIVDRRYSLAIVQLVSAVSRYESFMMFTGSGPEDKDSFRLLTKLGWRHQAVPFFFTRCKLRRFFSVLVTLKNIPSSVMARYWARTPVWERV